MVNAADGVSLTVKGALEQVGGAESSPSVILFASCYDFFQSSFVDDHVSAKLDGDAFKGEVLVSQVGHSHQLIRGGQGELGYAFLVPGGVVNARVDRGLGEIVDFILVIGIDGRAGLFGREAEVGDDGEVVGGVDGLLGAVHSRDLSLTRADSEFQDVDSLGNEAVVQIIARGAFLVAGVVVTLMVYVKGIVPRTVDAVFLGGNLVCAGVAVVDARAVVDGGVNQVVKITRDEIHGVGVVLLDLCQLCLENVKGLDTLHAANCLNGVGAVIGGLASVLQMGVDVDHGLTVDVEHAPRHLAATQEHVAGGGVVLAAFGQHRIGGILGDAKLGKMRVGKLVFAALGGEIGNRQSNALMRAVGGDHNRSATQQLQALLVVDAAELGGGGDGGINDAVVLAQIEHGVPGQSILLESDEIGFIEQDLLSYRLNTVQRGIADNTVHLGKRRLQIEAHHAQSRLARGGRGASAVCGIVHDRLQTEDVAAVICRGDPTGVGTSRNRSGIGNAHACHAAGVLCRGNVTVVFTVDQIDVGVLVRDHTDHAARVVAGDRDASVEFAVFQSYGSGGVYVTENTAHAGELLSIFLEDSSNRYIGNGDVGTAVYLGGNGTQGVLACRGRTAVIGIDKGEVLDHGIAANAAEHAANRGGGQLHVKTADGMTLTVKGAPELVGRVQLLPRVVAAASCDDLLQGALVEDHVAIQLDGNALKGADITSQRMETYQLIGRFQNIFLLVTGVPGGIRGSAVNRSGGSGRIYRLVGRSLGGLVGGSLGGLFGGLLRRLFSRLLGGLFGGALRGNNFVLRGGRAAVSALALARRQGKNQKNAREKQGKDSFLHSFFPFLNQIEAGSTIRFCSSQLYTK